MTIWMRFRSSWMHGLQADKRIVSRISICKAKQRRKRAPGYGALCLCFSQGDCSGLWKNMRLLSLRDVLECAILKENTRR